MLCSADRAEVAVPGGGCGDPRCARCVWSEQSQARLPDAGSEGAASQLRRGAQLPGN